MQFKPACRNLGERLPIAGILLATAVLAGDTTHPAPPITANALPSARAFKDYTVYWAGLEVNGAPLTAAVSPAYSYSPVGFAMYYSDCEGRGILRDGAAPSR